MTTTIDNNRRPPFWVDQQDINSIRIRAALAIGICVRILRSVGCSIWGRDPYDFTGTILFPDDYIPVPFDVLRSIEGEPKDYSDEEWNKIVESVNEEIKQKRLECLQVNP